MSIFKDIGALELNKSKLAYRWKIENFGISYKNLDGCLTSPVFTTLHSNTVKEWRMRLYPREYLATFENHSAIFLDYLSEGKVSVSIKFSIFDPIANITVNEIDLGVQIFQSKYESHGSNYFVDRNNALMQNDTLTLVCEISSARPVIVPKPVPDVSSDKIDLKEYGLEGDLEKLFESELLGDVIIKFGNERKSLHKAILANRSDVFRAMFEHDMIEKEISIVDIVDIRFEVAIEMFRYMYTGRVNHIEKWADELLIAAEKYAVTGLKVMCERALCGHLGFDNALEYLSLAFMYNTIHLKKEAIDFVVANLTNFVDKPQFKSLDQSVMCELLSAVAKKKTKY